MTQTATGEVKLIRFAGDPADLYPKSDRYQFQEFAGLVFEYGGYHDITVVNPGTGDRLWVSGVGVRECETAAGHMHYAIHMVEQHTDWLDE